MIVYSTKLQGYSGQATRMSVPNSVSFRPVASLIVQCMHKYDRRTDRSRHGPSQ